MWTAPDAPTCISEQASFTENLGFGPLGKAATCLRFKHLFIHPLAAPRTTQVHLGAKSYIRRQNDCGLPPAASSTVWNWLREIAQTRSKVLQFFFSSHELSMGHGLGFNGSCSKCQTCVKHVSKKGETLLTCQAQIQKALGDTTSESVGPWHQDRRQP